MADKKISQLNAASIAQATDIIPIVRNGQNYSLELSKLSGITEPSVFIKSVGNYSIKALNDTEINALGNYSFASGKDNVTLADYSSIIGGIYNFIFSGSSSAILGGFNNQIYGENSAIIAGSSNLVNASNVVILGGVGITGGTANTTYLPNLNINYIPISGSISEDVLVRMPNGDIQTRTTSSISPATVPWSAITSTPTTISGYGITDSYTKTELDNRYVNITGDTMSGDLTISTLSGTSLRTIYIDTTGKLIAGDEIGDIYITGSTIITALELNSNWNGTIFTGATDFSSLSSGQKYVSSGYTYEYVNTTMYRNYAPDTLSFSAITNTPTTISGYGITDFNILKSTLIDCSSATTNTYSFVSGPSVFNEFFYRFTNNQNCETGKIIINWNVDGSAIEYTAFSPATFGDCTTISFDVIPTGTFTANIVVTIVGSELWQIYFAETKI